MDKIKDSGSFALGSIPSGLTKIIGQSRSNWLPIFSLTDHIRTYPILDSFGFFRLEIPITSLYL